MTTSREAEESAFDARWKRNVHAPKLPHNEPILHDMRDEFYAGWQAACEWQKQQVIDKLESQVPCGYVNPAVMNSLNNNCSSCTIITPHRVFSTDIPLFTRPKEL